MAWALLACCALLVVALGTSIQAWRNLRKTWVRDHQAHQELTRLARVTASDLRNTALVLLGHAQSAEGGDHGFLLGTQASLLDLTEALLRQTEVPNAGHHLQEEVVRLRPMIDFAVAQITCQLGSGRRTWRIAEDLKDIELLGDRRALHQVVLRVLTSAVLSTRDGDCITLAGTGSGNPDLGGWSLWIEDEGAGLPLEASRPAGRETRGWGVGLTLAQSLMQAHGGHLAVQSAASVGTRVRLEFPASRLLAA